MRKIVPYLPLLTLIFGLLIVQSQSWSPMNSLLSNTLSPVSGEVSVEVCTQPEKFSKPSESAWCNRWLAMDIEERLNSWNWSCVTTEKIYSCHFTENTKYRTRWGTLFKK